MSLYIRAFSGRVLAGFVAASLIGLAVTAGFTSLGSEPAQAAAVVQAPVAGVVPTAVPAAPIVVDVLGEGLGIGVAWLPDDPADAVTSFTITATPVASTETAACPSPAAVAVDVGAPATGMTVPGLCAQVAYTSTVVAHNAVGSSALSNVSDPAAALEAQVASVPVITGTLGRDGAALVGWAPSAYDGGSGITSFAITVTDVAGAVVGGAVVDAAEASTTVAGLTNDVEYRVSVMAVNGIGSSAPSTATVTPRAAYAPGAPRDFSVVPDAADGIALSWSAPVDDGGAVIASYAISYQRAELLDGVWSTIDGAPRHSLTASAAQASVVVTDFEDTAGSYLFGIAAVNSVGAGDTATSSSAVSPLVVIKDTTVVLDDATTTDVDVVTATSLAWSPTVPAQIASVAVGDVLVAGVSPVFPSGLLREVTSIAVAGNGTVTLTTVDASLDDVFASMSMSTSGDTATSPGEGEDSGARSTFVPATSGLRAWSPSVGGKATVSADAVLQLRMGWKAGSAEKGGSVEAYVKGQVGVSAEASIDVSVSGWNPHATVTAQAIATSKSSFEVGIRAKKEWVLGTIYGPTATIPVGPVPVVVGVKLVVVLQAGGELKFTATLESKTGGSVTWDSKDPSQLTVTNLSEPIKVWGGDAPGVSFTGSAYVALKIEVIAAIYGLGGPSVSATGKLEVKINFSAGPGDAWLTITPSLELKAGVAFEILGFYGAAEASIGVFYAASFTNSTVPRAEYVVSPTIDTVAAGTPRTFTATRTDSVVRPITWTIEGGVLEDRISGDGTFIPAIPEGRVVDIVASDATGATGRAHVTVGLPFDPPSSLNLSANTGDTDGTMSLAVSWAAPAHTGGAALTDYVVSTTPDTGTHIVTGTSIDLDGIPADNYLVEVRARNSNGRISVPTSGSYYRSACQQRVDAGNVVFFAEDYGSCSLPRTIGTMSSTLDGIMYSVDIADLGSGASAVAYDGVTQEWDVVIASRVNIGGKDYTVTSIGERAFSQHGLDTVVIPDSVTEIGFGAFMLNGLFAVDIPDSVTYIGDYAFSDNHLPWIVISDSVTYIGERAFHDNKLTSVSVGKSVTHIGGEAFNYNENLRSITIGESVSDIGYYAFSGGEYTSVTIPESVAIIGFQAFYSSTLQSVVFKGDMPTLARAPWDASSALLPFGGGTPGGPMVSYYERHAGSGFTSPTWRGGVIDYRSQALATVTFDANGHGVAPSESDLVVGFSVDDPGPATATGLIFVGWFSEASGGDAVTFPYVVSSDTTLYAHWVSENLFTLAPDPTITGSATVGSVLTANAGTWAPVPTSFTYSWLRNGVAIAGATQSTYRLVQADLGTSITVSVTAVKATYQSLSKVSAATAVNNVYSAAPVPTIAGSTVMGSVLTAATGTWAPVPTSFTYAWLRNGSAITGATQSAYTLVEADLGMSITVSVTAIKAGYSATSKVSAGKVVPYGYSIAPVPTITGSTVMGSVLTANTGTWAPVPASFTYVWRRNGTAISGATQKTYTLVEADLGKAITVSVTAVKTNYPATSKVSATTNVPYGYSVAPVPTITGSTTVGSVLTANTGTWAPVPASFTYVWRRNGTAISGATQKTYKIVQADRGKTLTVSVTAVKTNYPATSKVSAGKAVP